MGGLYYRGPIQSPHRSVLDVFLNSDENKPYTMSTSCIQILSSESGRHIYVRIRNYSQRAHRGTTCEAARASQLWMRPDG